MIKTKKIKTTSSIEEVMQTVKEMAQDMEIDLQPVMTLFRMDKGRALPVLRSDFSQQDLITILLTVIWQEQKQDVLSIDWEMVLDQVWMEMNEDQRNCVMANRLSKIH